VMLIHPNTAGYGISWSVIVPVAIACALFVFFVAGMAVKAWKRPVVSGSEEMVGSSGEMLEDLEGNEGWAQVHGETWRVRSRQPLRLGQTIKVVRMHGLILDVEPEQGRKE
jgi:membrane-bound serine protease (ClpP class)